MPVARSLFARLGFLPGRARTEERGAKIKIIGIGGHGGSESQRKGMVEGVGGTEARERSDEIRITYAFGLIKLRMTFLRRLYCFFFVWAAGGVLPAQCGCLYYSEVRGPDNASKIQCVEQRHASRPRCR